MNVQEGAEISLNERYGQKRDKIFLVYCLEEYRPKCMGLFVVNLSNKPTQWLGGSLIMKMLSELGMSVRRRGQFL